MNFTEKKARAQTLKKIIAERDNETEKLMVELHELEIEIAIEVHKVAIGDTIQWGSKKGRVIKLTPYDKGLNFVVRRIRKDGSAGATVNVWWFEKWEKVSP